MFLCSRRDIEKHAGTARTRLNPLQTLLGAQDMLREITQLRDRLSLHGSTKRIPEIARQATAIEQAILGVRGNEQLRRDAKRLRDDKARAYLSELHWVRILHPGLCLLLTLWWNRRSRMSLAQT